MAKQVKFVPKMANLSTGDGPILYVWGDAEEEGAIQQLQMCCSIQDFQGKPQMNVKGALMADNHIAEHLFLFSMELIFNYEHTISNSKISRLSGTHR